MVVELVSYDILESCAVTLPKCAVLAFRLPPHHQFWASMESNASSKNAATRGGKRSKRPSEHRLAIIGIRTATSEIEVNTQEIKKGTLFDDESYIVRQGTEPNLLIAKAAGLEAFIPNGDAASGRANSRVGCSSRTPGKTLLGEISVQVILGVDNLALP